MKWKVNRSCGFFGNISSVALVLFIVVSRVQGAPDGRLITWGGNRSGESTIPPYVETNAVRAVAPGLYYTLALLEDGSVTGWGDNSYGQLDIPTAAQSGVIAIAAGSRQGVALRKDGVVLSWGKGPNAPSNLTGNVKAISAGANHNVALLLDGTVKVWGAGLSQGQGNVPDEARNITQISAGLFFTLALRADGRVIAWGSDIHGQTILPAEAQQGVVAVAAGGFHGLALRDNGSVVAWGYNRHGECDVPDAAKRDVVAIAAGGYHSLALKRDGTLVTWGRSMDGQNQIPYLDKGKVTQIACGLLHSAVVTRDPVRVALENIHSLARQESVNHVQGSLQQVRTDLQKLEQTVTSALAGNNAALQETKNLILSRASQNSVNQLISAGIGLSGSTEGSLAIGENSTVLQNSLTQLSEALEGNVDLLLRVRIEEYLRAYRPGEPKLALFYLPQAHGGHLEFVKEIVADTIALQKRAGLPVGFAETILQTGQNHYAQGKYKDALDAFAGAYGALSR